MTARELKICPQRGALLKCSGHILVLGGPGSGKTTIALVKAATDLAAGVLGSEQKILFLSFARATVTRVMQEAQLRVPKDSQPSLEISTYHGFAWSFIQTHGYLLTGKKTLRILPPPEACGRLAGTARDYRRAKLHELLDQEGLLGFDLFADLTANLLEQSPRLCALLSDSYPVIVVDEFQDTNRDEWRMIVALGKSSRLIALADAEQRIYEFRGADPARIGEFIAAFRPTMFDFGKENNRSDGTDITNFGDDLLTGANIGKIYSHVKVERYGFRRNALLSPGKYAVLAARQRLIRAQTPTWSIAVLVSSKDMMLQLSNYLLSVAGALPEIPHEVLLDPEGPALAAILIAGLMQGSSSAEELTSSLTTDLINHMRGRKGGDISQADLALSGALEEYLRTRAIRGTKRQELVSNLKTIAARRMQLTLTGDPTADWLTIRCLLDTATHEKGLAVAEDARFVRLLNRGTLLRESLSEQWRTTASYNQARKTVSSALLQEHFSNSTRTWTGINVMTIHKSKGKDFDEVIVFEGSRIGRLVRQNATVRDVEQSRLALRVAVTRARQRTTILTPKWECCSLL